MGWDVGLGEVLFARVGGLEGFLGAPDLGGGYEMFAWTSIWAYGRLADDGICREDGA